MSHPHPELSAPPELAPGGLRVIPLGGLGEVGRNMTVFEYDGRLLIVDCGVLFPEENHPGVDLILPDFEPIRDRLDDIEALVLTHGHEDHIGATPFLLRERGDIPLVGSELTLALLDSKLREHRLRETIHHKVREGDRLTLGPFDLEFVAVNHSIPDALAVAIRTGAGLVLHTGDFKLDQLPLDGRITDLRAFARLGEEGVDLFMVDSTNAEVPGFTTSEQEIAPVLERVFHESRQRIIVACFASHVHRVQQILDAAVEHDRKVAYVGRSMVRNMAIARDLGYLTVPPGTLVDAKELTGLAPERQVLVSTGSQGEPLSALSRIAQRNHHFVHIESGDTVVLASSLIPGNENAVYRVINGLARWGANVVHKGNALVHVSGHASAGELLYCYNIVRPRNVLPVHGEIRHLLANGALARKSGVRGRERRHRRGRRRGRPHRRCRLDRRQGGLRLRLRRRVVGGRHHGIGPEGPANPRRGGVHLCHRGHRLGDRQGVGRPGDPCTRFRGGRLDLRRDQAADHRRPPSRCQRGFRRHVPTSTDGAPCCGTVGQQHPPTPPDDHSRGHRGLTGRALGKEPMARFDTFHADGVRRLYEVTRRVNSSADLAEVLELIANGVCEGLGYGVAAISRLEGNTLVMAAVAGDDAVRDEIIGRRTPADQVLGREFSIADHWGILRFVPHDRLPPEQISSLWVPNIEVSDDPDAWHPLDALYAPLYSSSGKLLGNMAVDLPPDSKVPNQQQRELLEMFVVQAGVALENAQRREQLSHQVRHGEALKKLALLSGTLEIEPALQEAAEALFEALTAAQVTMRCFADNVEDHENYSAGMPAPANADATTVLGIREDLERQAVQGQLRPVVFSERDQDFGGLESAPLIRARMEKDGWTHGLLAPIGVDREVMGYLVMLREQAHADFDPDEIGAIHEAGRELGRLVRDVRIRRTERRLLGELRELDRYKGELIATISHELKTPLTSIIGHTELLEEAGVLPNSVSAISRNAARLDRLVTNLLNYSRIQGRRELQRVPLDLVEVCRTSLEMLRIQAQSAGVSLELLPPDTGPVLVLGDAEELPRVVDNLCSNAVKYTPSGGRIEVSVRAHDGLGEVLVRDSGLGISPQDQVHLFSAFHRSTNPEALTIPGTGLGLAISRTIAELHGGDIGVESVLGTGSEFTVRIPLIDA